MDIYTLLCIKCTSQVVLLVQNSPANAGDSRDAGLIPELGRSPGGGHGSPLQAWRIPWTGAWQATLHRVTNSWTRPKQLSMHTHV